MAKFVILNFDETDRFRLTTERPELSLASSTFNPAKPGVFFLPEDSEAVFIQLIGLNPVKDLGHDAAPALSRFAEGGGKVVCFIGPSDQAELGKLIGSFPELHFQPNSLPESVFFTSDEPFQSVFDQFQMSISHAYKLLPAALAGDAWEGSPKLSRAASVLAKSSDGCPVALLLPHGRGSYILLPWFGTNNIDVVGTLINPPEKKAASKPEIVPPPKPEPEPVETPKVARDPSLADLEAVIAGITKPVPERENLAPPKPEPEPIKAPGAAGEPSVPELESVTAAISKPAPEPELAPAKKQEPAPTETPDVAHVPSLADAGPTGPEIPGPAPEPEVLRPPEPEPVPEETPRTVSAPSVPELKSAIAAISKPVHEPELPPSTKQEIAPTETTDMAPAPSLADAGPVIAGITETVPEPEILAPPKPEPVREEAPGTVVAPSLADAGPVIVGVSKPLPEPEIPPPAKQEPAPTETPDSVDAPSLADMGPVVPEIPRLAAEPEVLPPPKPETGRDEVVEPQPAQVPDKISVPSIPDLVAGGEEIAWLEQEEYAFPELREIYARREEETQRYAKARQDIEQQHAQAMQDIEQRLQAFKASGQEAFLHLLRSEGPELVQAVIFVLKYLGWSRVIDVHDYWKKVIRAKEEEIWVMESESPSVEVGLMRDKLLLVLVRSGKAWATDDECALLQRYKGRRMQEYNNTQMRALLIGNYFMTAEGKSRTSPFSPLQVEEAQKDGNALLSTYDLFQAIKAEKEGRVTKDALRRQLLEKSGLVQFEF